MFTDVEVTTKYEITPAITIYNALKTSNYAFIFQILSKHGMYTLPITISLQCLNESFIARYDGLYIYLFIYYHIVHRVYDTLH